jgi:hypothetical protein
MESHSVDVVLQSVGFTPGVLEPPLAKYKPQIVVLFTSEQSLADITIEHVGGPWKKHVNRMPEVITKIVKDPWTKDTVERYMIAFDEAVKEIQNHELVKNKQINWHVGTAGGTNLMAIASALSAFTHRFPVYGSLDSKFQPLEDTQNLAIEIELFSNLGPGHKALQKERSMKIMKYIAKNGPVIPQLIAEHLNCSKQNESAGRRPLTEACLIVKGKNGWNATHIGKMLLTFMSFEEE